MKKLSNRAIAILCCIREDSEGGCYWSPSLDYLTDGDWCEEFHSNLYIGGSDGSIILSLRRKALLEEVTSKNYSTNKYASRITEDGCLAIEKARESGQLDEAKEEQRRRDAALSGHPSHD